MFFCSVFRKNFRLIMRSSLLLCQFFDFIGQISNIIIYLLLTFDALY